jgi:hypothetical protein
MSFHYDGMGVDMFVDVTTEYAPSFTFGDAEADNDPWGSIKLAAMRKEK